MFNALVKSQTLDDDVVNMLKSKIQKRKRMKTKPVILVVDDQPQNMELLEAYPFRQRFSASRQN
jgi:hypothetical protein